MSKYKIKIVKMLFIKGLRGQDKKLRIVPIIKIGNGASWMHTWGFLILFGSLIEILDSNIFTKSKLICGICPKVIITKLDIK